MLHVLLIILLIISFLGILPVEVRFFYHGWSSGHSLLIRLEFFEGRVGIGKKIALGQNGYYGGHRLAFLEKTKIGAPFQRFFWERLRFPRTSRDMLRAYYHYRKLLYYLKGFLERGCCKQLHWETELGFQDYALTGMAVGLTWAGKGAVLGYMSRSMRIEQNNVRVSVIPRFGKRCLTSCFHCIFKTRLGHIIVTLSRFFIWLIKIIWENKKR